MANNELTNKALLDSIRHLITEARTKVQRTVNSVMVQTYWEIGRLIVEDEQQGKSLAAYGKQQLEELATELTEEFGRGFNARNLRNMRAFYETYPIWKTVSSKLSWSHYCHLIKVNNQQAREWYANEAIEQSWSVRALSRQISVFYYERLLASKEDPSVKAEAVEKTKPLAESPTGYLRDPYLLDFLNLSSGPYQETELEQGLIDNLKDFLLEPGKGFAFVERQQRIQRAFS